MSDSDSNFNLVPANQESLVLSTPGSILAKLTFDVLPIAYQIKVNDDQVAQPIYEQGLQHELAQNFEAALIAFLKASNLGHEAAQYRAGELLLNGHPNVNKNYSEAYQWFHRSAEQGNADALNRLGWMCEAGLGVPRDQSRAVNWFRQAAERGHLEAQFNLGAKYDNGEGVTQNHAEATRWYQISAEQGFTDARFFLAQALEIGEGIPKNIQEAIDWYILAAEDGHKSARLKLWAFAIDGVFEPEDVAEEVFIEEIGAEIGNPLALFKLGYRYDLGIGLERDPLKALRNYERSAEKGFLQAYIHIQLWREYKRGIEVQPKLHNIAASMKVSTESFKPLWMYLEDKVPDIDQVSRFREHLIKADSGVAISMGEVTKHYYFGKGVKTNLPAALHWAELGVNAHDPYCQYVYGYMKLYGQATSIDKAVALDNLTKASKAGNAHAKRLAADLMLELFDVKTQTSKAITMLKELADEGDASAQFTLGYRYSNGLKVKKSENLAIHYYQLSADQGNASALFNLGIKYEYGHGLKKDVMTALNFYRRSAEKGLISACEQLENFYTQGKYVLKDSNEAARWSKMAKQYKEKEAQNDAIQITHDRSVPLENARKVRLAGKRSLRVRNQHVAKADR